MKYVAVTHFISPYIFWCHKIDVPVNISTKIFEEEKKLEVLYNDSANERSLAPLLKSGAKVAVKYLYWQRFIRATVLDFVSQKEHYGEYLLWAIDYGFPLHSKVEYIRLVPESSDFTVDHIIRAGIANVLPAAKFYDTSCFSWVTERKKEWSQPACEALERVLVDAARIVFRDYFTIINQCWGDLEITNNSGYKILASTFLLKYEAAINSGPEFREQRLWLSVAQMPLWTSKNGRLKENIFPNSDKLPQSLVRQRANKIDTMPEREIPEWCLLYNPDSGDSASKKQLRHSAEAAKLKGDDIGAMGMEGLLGRLRNMHIMCQPPLPSPEIFDIILPPTAAHRRRLLEQKLSITPKQLTLNQTDVSSNPSHDACTEKVENAARPDTAPLSQALLVGAGSPSTDIAYSSLDLKKRQHQLNEFRLKYRNMQAKNNSGDSDSAIVRRERSDELENQQSVAGQSPSVHSALHSVHSHAIIFEKMPLIWPRSEAYPDFRKVGKGNEQQPIYHEVDSSLIVPSGSNLGGQRKESNHSRYEKDLQDNLMDEDFIDYFDPSEEQDFRFGWAHRDKIKILPTTPAKSEKNENNTKIRLHAEQDSKETVDSSIRLESLASKLLPPNQERSGMTERQNIKQIEKLGNEMESESDSKQIVRCKELSESTECVHLLNELQSQDFCCIGLSLDQLSLKEIYGESILRTHFIDHLMLAHSKVPLQTVTKRIEANFSPKIHESMSYIGISRLLRLQAYAWPHLLRGNSLVAVNPYRSGKTWTYLPVLCTLISFQTINELPNDFGPVAIVLVATYKCAEYVTAACRHLMGSVIKRSNGKSEMSVVPYYGTFILQEAKMQLFHGCGVLVATPSYLLQLLRENAHQSLINPARLKLLVIDDLDQIMERNRDEFGDIWREVFKIVPKTPNGTMVPQLVVMSRLWDQPLMIGLLQRCNRPLLLIGDHLEAALYGKAALTMKFTEHNTKESIIQDFITENPRHIESLLIMCGHDSEVDHIVQVLNDCGYSCTGYTSQSGAAERVLVSNWKNRLNCKKILVCSDDNLPELELQNAKNLIHYSFPTTWTKFTSRFATVLRSYENHVANDFTAMFPGNSAGRQKSKVVNLLILLDEENRAQLPRLADFLRRHNQEHSLPAVISTAIQHVLIHREDSRLARGVLICPDILEFGNCDEPHCKYRHNLMASDKIPPNEDIPSVGEMRVLILKVFSGSHYSARLLKYRAPGATEWRELRQSYSAGVFMMRMRMYYANVANRIMYWPPKVDDLCIHQTGNDYHRARIIEVPALEQTKFIRKVKLCIKLIDIGDVKIVMSDELLVCAEQFRDFPALAVEMRLSGVRPFNNDRTWDTKAVHSVTKRIMTDISPTMCVHVNVHFALANSIWVHNVYVVEWLPTLHRYIYRVNLKKKLLKELMAVRCASDDNGIYDIALKMGLIDDGTWAADALSANTQSDCQGDQAVMADCTSACSQQLSLATRFEDTNKMKDKRDDVLGDDLPKKRPTKPAESFAVATPHNISTAMAMEEWCALLLDEMQLVQINAEGDWSEIYVSSLALTTSSSRRYKELVALIKEHVGRQKAVVPKRKFLLPPMRSCILKYGDIYTRAKLFSVCDDLHRFLLCDYAIFVDVHVLNLWNDCVYETSEEIIAYAPYNSIHCTLTGIDYRQLAGGERMAFTKRYQYVYVVGENVHKTDTDSPNWHKLGMRRSYKVLLFECDKRDDYSDATLLNKMLVERGATTRDPDTEHFLEICLNVDFSDFELGNPEELFRFANGSGSGYGSVKTKIEDLFKFFQHSFEVDGDNDCIECTKQLPKNTDLKRTARQTTTDNKKKQNNKKKQKKQPIVKTAQAGAECIQPKPQIKYSSPNESTSTSDVKTESVSSTSASPAVMPQLIRTHKCLPTIYNETECCIYLKIYAPDIDDYYLSVTADKVHFSTRVNGELCAVLLNLLGTVEPQYTTQEKRGLNVVVRLVKSLYIKWPRLLMETTKLTWLTFDFNAIETMEEPRFQHLQTKLIPSNELSDSDEENSDGRNLLTSYPPIENDLEFDPVEELF